MMLSVTIIQLMMQIQPVLELSQEQGVYPYMITAGLSNREDIYR